MTTAAPPSPARTRPRPSSVVAMGYAVLCYAAFVAVLGYAVAFLADVVVPRTVDHGGPSSSTPAAVVMDAALLLVFAVQHSVMARPGFKRRWTRLVPRHVERSSYVLVASAALALAFWQWRPIPASVWEVHQPVGRALLWLLFAVGWLWVLAMSYAIDHLDFVGLRQVARHLRGAPPGTPGFVTPWPYRLVRHPMMLGFLPALLATPTMSAGHLLFAGLGLGYIVVGTRFEERDLAAELPEYAAYAAATPRFWPVRRRSPRAGRAA